MAFTRRGSGQASGTPARRIAALALTLVAILSAAGSGVGMVRSTPTQAGQAERRTPVVVAIQKVQPCVVSISSEKRSASSSRWPFSPEENQRPRVSGMGTGVLVDHRGYVLTNQHVVHQVEGIEVQLSDGATYPARVVQQDPAMDIALLKIDAGRPLPVVRIGSSADLMVGETVITIGNAFGYENSASVGIVSFIGRSVTLSDDQVYRNLIQTDACINPGNSGGPLVNIEGELIGINVAVRAGAQGIGFALPIDDVKRVALEMMSTRRLAATWHGLSAREVGSGDGRAVVLADVLANSPAEAAGFRRGDQVMKVGTVDVATPLDIERGLLDVRPGQRAEVVVRREGKEQMMTLAPEVINRSTLAAHTAALVAPAPTVDPSGDQLWRRLGLKVVPVARDYVRRVSPNFRGGLYVQAVQPGGAAARAAIQKGDILVGMNAANRAWETIRPDNILFILNQPDVSQNRSVQYYLVRQNELIEGSLSLGDGASTALRR